MLVKQFETIKSDHRFAIDRNKGGALAHRFCFTLNTDTQTEKKKKKKATTKQQQKTQTYTRRYANTYIHRQSDRQIEPHASTHTNIQSLTQTHIDKVSRVHIFGRFSTEHFLTAVTIVVVPRQNSRTLINFHTCIGIVHLFHSCTQDDVFEVAVDLLT